jgi:hypothetical protein
MIEENRARYQLAGSNPKLYMDIFGNEDEEEIDTEEVEWTSPDSSEAIEDILKTLNGVNRGSEVGMGSLVESPSKPE